MNFDKIVEQAGLNPRIKFYESVVRQLGRLIETQPYSQECIIYDDNYTRYERLEALEYWLFGEGCTQQDVATRIPEIVPVNVRYDKLSWYVLVASDSQKAYCFAMELRNLAIYNQLDMTTLGPDTEGHTLFILSSDRVEGEDMEIL